MSYTWTIACCLFLAGVALGQDSGARDKPHGIEIKNLQGQVIGKGTISAASPKGVKLDLRFTNLPPGSHIFHIHQKPVCDASEEFDTAGLQYDPTGEMYGSATHSGHGGHSAGDPRMSVDAAADGTGQATVTFPALTLGSDDHSVFYNGGTAIVFHAATGAKGPTRIACGIIQNK
jgi:Cu-Zn family superoxide dismutase